MNTIKFNDKDSYTDFNLILRPKSIPFPTPKTNYVNIEGRDGDLDLTTSLSGDVRYENISYSLEFYLNKERTDWTTALNKISTYLHGKKVKLKLSEDPNWEWEARITLNDFESDKNIGLIVLDCNMTPYRTKTTETVVTEEVVANKVVTLSNSRKWVMPTINTTSEVKFTHGTKQITVNGTLQTPDFILKEGETTITLISGTGNIVFTYKEAKF